VTQTPETGNTPNRESTQVVTSEKGDQPELNSETGVLQADSEIGADPLVSETGAPVGSDTGAPLIPQHIDTVEEAQNNPRNRIQGVISMEYKGCIMNPDGTFTMTPQFRTWVLKPRNAV